MVKSSLFGHSLGFSSWIGASSTTACLPFGGALPFALGSSGSLFARPRFQGRRRIFSSSSVSYSPASFLVCKRKYCRDFLAFSARPGSASSQLFLRAASRSSFSVSLTIATVSDEMIRSFQVILYVSSLLGSIQLGQSGILNAALITYLCLYSFSSGGSFNISCSLSITLKFESDGATALTSSFGLSYNPAFDHKLKWDMVIC